VTRTVSIPFREAHAPAWDAAHATHHVGFEGSLRINRRDFGILGGARHNGWFDEARARTVPDTVVVRFRVEGSRTDFARRDGATVDSVLRRRFAGDVARAVAAYDVAQEPGHPDAAAMRRFAGIFGRVLLERGDVSRAVALLRLDAAADTASADQLAALGGPTSSRATTRTRSPCTSGCTRWTPPTRGRRSCCVGSHGPIAQGPIPHRPRRARHAR
jgi:hypothetical protein